MAYTVKFDPEKNQYNVVSESGYNPLSVPCSGADSICKDRAQMLADRRNAEDIIRWFQTSCRSSRAVLETIQAHLEDFLAGLPDDEYASLRKAKRDFDDLVERAPEKMNLFNVLSWQA